MAYTPLGIEYTLLVDEYQERFVRDANQITCLIQCAWADAADLKREFLGFTEVDRTGAEPILRRTLPLLCPFTATKRAVSMDLVQFGGDPEQAGVTTPSDDGIPLLTPIYRNDFYLDGDPEFDGWWETDLATYRVTFARPPWTFTRTDEEIAGPEFLGDELARYVLRSDNWNIRERRSPDWGFETDEASPVPTGSQVGFVKDIEIEVVYTWYQIPYDAVPRTAIDAAALTLNNAAFDVSKWNYSTGRVLFKGVRGIDKPYEAAGSIDELYVDIQYVFGVRQRDWNEFQKANGDWVLMRRKGVEPVRRPYEYSDFADLFKPQ